MSIRELIASLLCETNIDEEVTASHILKAYGLPDRKVGEWIYDKFNRNICSVCGKGEFRVSDFCPNCGAIMGRVKE